jgi:hypothetical protein
LGFWTTPLRISIAWRIVGSAFQAALPAMTVATNGISASLVSHVAESQRDEGVRSTGVVAHAAANIGSANDVGRARVRWVCVARGRPTAAGARRSRGQRGADRLGALERAEQAEQARERLAVLLAEPLGVVARLDEVCDGVAVGRQSGGAQHDGADPRPQGELA